MTTDTRTQHFDGGDLAPQAPAPSPNDSDATKLARGQQMLADHLMQEFRNRHPVHGSCPRDQIEQAVHRATDDKETPPDFTNPDGITAFLDRVRDQMEAPRDDMLGELSEWQTQHGFY